MLLDEFLGRNDKQLRKSQFHPADMANVSRHHVACAPCQGKFDKVIVRLIAQVRPPAEVNTRPFTVCQEDIQEFASLFCRQPRSREQRPAPEDIFVFSQQCRTHQRHCTLLQACGDDGARRADPEAGSDKDVGVDDDDHKGMVANLPPFNQPPEDAVPRQP